MSIAPSLLSADPLNLELELQALNSLPIDRLHIDVMDGHFVPNWSFSPIFVRSIRQRTMKTLDVHLMVTPVEPAIDAFAKFGADIITFHPEATYHPYRALQQIKKYGLKAGIALNPGTSIHILEPFLPLIDEVLLMSVNPGFGGQDFIESSLKKLTQIRNFIGTDITLVIDGGITEKNVNSIFKAGADIAVSGTSFFHNSGKTLLQKTEVYKKRLESLNGSVL